MPAPVAKETAGWRGRRDRARRTVRNERLAIEDERALLCARRVGRTRCCTRHGDVRRGGERLARRRAAGAKKRGEPVRTRATGGRATLCRG